MRVLTVLAESMSAMLLRSQLRTIFVQIYPISCTISNCKYSTDVPSKKNDNFSESTIKTKTTNVKSDHDNTIEIRRQKAGEKPVLKKMDDFVANIESWKTQLPHEEDPSILTHNPDPRDRYHKGPTNHGWGFSSDYIVKVSKRWDFSQEGIAEWARQHFYKQNKEKQKFNPMRHAILGPDLATAHFITFRGGRVKFVGHTEWWLENNNLPNSYEDGYIIEKIDASCK